MLRQRWRAIEYSHRAQRDRLVGSHQVGIGGHERVLHGILGVARRAEHVVAEGEQRPVMAVEQRLERRRRAGPYPVDQVLVGRESKQHHRSCIRHRRETVLTERPVSPARLGCWPCSCSKQESSARG
jgi:hypothetical protein